MSMSSQEVSDAVESIAVIGMAGRFPGARNIDEFWQNLRDGRETITRFSDEELLASGVSPELINNPAYVKAGGILENLDIFDAAFFGFTPREAEMTDPQQRIFLQEAWKALEDAGYDPETYPRLIGVYAGVGMNGYLYNLYSNPGLIELFGIFQTLLGNDKDFLSTRVSYKLNLRGPSVTVQTACSTSLVAVHMACQSLLYYQCDIALAGGVSVSVPQKAGYLYQEGGILSPDGHCRAFDARAQGFVGGSGVGVVVLKRLTEAVADGDHIYAVIKGSAINNDGSLKVGFTAPSVRGQESVIAAAQALAGVEAETISYVEAHGTGTALGDPVEIAALTEVFRASTAARGFCAVGSVKTNIGHLDAAAGVSGLIKTVLALEHRELPPSLHYERPNPEIDFASSPFYVNATLSEWPAGRTPRRAGVSSLGLGGTNAHVILEEAPRPAPSAERKPWHLLTLSAKTATALEHSTADLAAHLRQHPELSLGDVAHTLHVGRRGFSHRRFIVCKELGEATAALDTLDPQRSATGFSEAADRPVVFMFPGGGAQHVNMGLGLYKTEPTFREQVELCVELLRPQLGFDLRDYLYPREARKEEAAGQMERAAVALPALFTMEYALSKLWMSWGVYPQAMIGHSLGEYVAACLAGVISLRDALALVALRGRLFEELPEGAMLSVPLTETEVRPLLGETLSLAAINGPALCVVSGAVERIDELSERLAARGVESSRVHISVAAHSEMVEAILRPFTAFVETLQQQPPRIPYISNVTGAWVTEAEATDPTYWARHLRQCVRFADGMNELLKAESPLLLEVGPGRTLSTLAKQNLGPTARVSAYSSLRWPDDPEPEMASLLHTLGQLWLAGKKVDWFGFHAGQPGRRVSLPTYPFEGQSYWVAPQSSAQREAGGRSSLRKKSRVADWFYLPSWKRTAPPSASGLTGLAGQRLRWLLFADESGLARSMTERLAELGQDVINATVGEQFERHGDRLFSLRPDSAEDYQRLLESLLESGPAPNVVVHLWSLTTREPEASDARWFAETQPRGYYSLLYLSRALGQQTAEKLDVVLISNHLHDVSGEERTCPEKATLLGPCKVIAQEHLNIACRSIDITLPASGTHAEARLTDQLLAEILASSDVAVAYRGNQRSVQSYENVGLAGGTEPARRLREGGVYLITGGLGGIGLLLAEHLAETFKARLVLLGRSTLPPRDAWAEWLETHPPEDATGRKIRKILRLEELGSEVLLVGADVADEGQMRAVMELIDKRFGELHGVLHAAGITGGPSVLRPLSEIGHEESELQFRPKVYGLYVLEKVLAGRTLDFCLLFSSNASVLGGLGLFAYAAANHFVDTFAAERSRDGLIPWVSANWDRWPVEGDAEQRPKQRSIDEYAMTVRESVEAFHAVATQAPPGQVIVSAGELAARINLWVRREFLKDTEAATDTFHSRPQLQTSYAAPEDEVQRAVAEVWQKLLGIERVGIHDNFFDLGGHSLLATRIVTRLRETFQVNLPLRSLFDHPTVAGLALEISHNPALDEDERPLTEANDPGDESAQELLARIDQLSEEQIDSLLDKYVS